MTKEITITTTRGGQITLSTDSYQIDASLVIKGKNHNFSNVQIKNNSRFGDYLEFGPVTAPISADTMKQIKSELVSYINAARAKREEAYKAEKQEFLASAAGKSWLLNKKMDNPNSDY